MLVFREKVRSLCKFTFQEKGCFRKGSIFEENGKIINFHENCAVFKRNLAFRTKCRISIWNLGSLLKQINIFRKNPQYLFDRCKKIFLNPKECEEMVNVENRCHWPLNCMNKQNEREICAIQYHKLLKQPFLFVCTKLQNHSPIYEAVSIASIDKRFMSIFRFHFVEYYCLMLIVNLSNSNLFWFLLFFCFCSSGNALW